MVELSICREEPALLDEALLGFVAAMQQRGEEVVSIHALVTRREGAGCKSHQYVFGNGALHGLDRVAALATARWLHVHHNIRSLFDQIMSQGGF